jgi:hypothetical protein
MSATGYTPIQIYYSTTASAVPVNTNLANGELAINITDGKLYYKDNTGTVKLLASNAATTNVSTISFGTTGLTPSTATSGAITVAGTLATANGGTNLTSFTSGGAMYATSTSALTTGTLPVTAGGTGIATLTAGYIPFGNGTSAFSNSSNLYFSGSKFGVNTATPAVTAVFVGTDAVQIPVGSNAQQPGQSGQPTPAAGMLRFNNSTTQFEGYNGSAWSSVGGAAISNDTSTASFEYPLFASATSGTALTVYTSNAKYLYKPSTGELQAYEVNATNGLLLNSATVSASYTIPNGTNAVSVGPVSVATGQSVTVPTGNRWVVL